MKRVGLSEGEISCPNGSFSTPYHPMHGQQWSTDGAVNGQAKNRCFTEKYSYGQLDPAN